MPQKITVAVSHPHAGAASVSRSVASPQLRQCGYFGERKIVNSYHNLSIEVIPNKANVLAVDNEGHCESWIDGKIAAIVWHPERMEVPWLPDEIENLLRG